MLSFPHLVVLFVIALIIFGPQKLPELARMLGKATAEFRKMTNDFRYALEDEVREMERQTRIKEEQTAAAQIAQAASAPQPPAALSAGAPAPEGSVPREIPHAGNVEQVGTHTQTETAEPAHPESAASPQQTAEAVSVSHEKTSDDTPAV